MTDKNWDLATVQNTTSAIEVFSKGNAEKLIGDLENEVRSVIGDVATPKGRKEIASLAHKVSRSKTALDALGKDLVGEWKAKSKAVDAERKVIRDRLDSLRDEVRLPLTEWEAEEKDREAKEKLDVEIAAAHENALEENALFNRQRELERKEEKQRIAQELIDTEEQARKDRRLAEDAAIASEKARLAREKQLQVNAAAEAKQEAAALIAKERAEAEQKIINARVAEENAVREKEEAEARRVSDLKEQELRLQRESDARDAARHKQEADESAAAEQRKNDQLHTTAIKTAAKEALIKHSDIDEAAARRVVIALCKRLVPNVSISY